MVFFYIQRRSKQLPHIIQWNWNVKPPGNEPAPPKWTEPAPGSLKNVWNKRFGSMLAETKKKTTNLL